MKKLILLVIIGILSLSFPIFAETGDALFKDNLEIKAIINSGEYYKLDEEVDLDASQSLLLKDIIPEYKWIIDGKEQKGEKIKIKFDKLGRHEVILKINQGDSSSEISSNIFSYDKSALIVSDRKQDLLQEMKLQAGNLGIWLEIIQYQNAGNALIDDEKLTQELSQNMNFIKDSSILIFDTQNAKGSQIFSEFISQNKLGNDVNLQDKLVIKLSEGNIGIDKNIIQKFYKLLGAKEILITRIEAINPILRSNNLEEIRNLLEKRAIEFTIIDNEIHANVLLVLSNIVTNLISQGVPLNIIYLILTFPFIAFFITFTRQVIGISSFGIYLPAVISLSFFILGIYFGLTVIIIILFFSYFIRKFIEKIELPYIPKNSLILSIIVLSFIFIAGFLLMFDIKISVVSAIFPMIIMTRISESFIGAEGEDGTKYALFATFETLIVAILAFLFVTWAPLLNLIISIPEIVFLPLIGNIIIGKYKGLRVSEIFKFKSFLKDGAEE